jgi:hypothetical protein
VRLIFGSDLAQAVVFANDLVDDRAAGGGVVAGERQRLAEGVVGGFEAADGSVDTGAERGGDFYLKNSSGEM